jgi:hypothetical protein
MPQLLHNTGFPSTNQSSVLGKESRRTRARLGGRKRLAQSCSHGPTVVRGFENTFVVDGVSVFLGSIVFSPTGE